MEIIEDKTFNHSLETAYRLLSGCLYQPSAAWAEADIFGHLKTALQVVAPSVVSQADAMEEAFNAVSETEIAVSYARLFVGPFSLGAPPYGSYYLEPEQKVMGNSTLAVQEFYRQAGLSLEQDFPELPDHMAVELEFLSFLLQRALNNSGEGDDARLWIDRRREFLQNFVAEWYGQFCAAIREFTDDPFYMAYATCLEAVIQRDLELLRLS